MRVRSVDAWHLRAPLSQPFSFSQFSYAQREAMLVRITTEDGCEGWGEAYGPAAVTAAIVREFLAPLLIGRDPRAVESNWELLYARSLDYGQKGVMLAAISALDIACWDLKAQDADAPLYRLLGAAPVESIECYWTGFYFGGNEPLERRWEREARDCLEQGFQAAKMKVGLGVARDAELVEAVRHFLGSGVKLSIDANHAYMPADAIELARRVEGLGIHWFEEPVSPLDPEAYLQVKSQTAIPIAGGECEATRFGFERWFRLRAVDFAQPDLCACGGITEGLKIATLGSLTGVHVTPHAWGSAVGQAAALHFYAARPRHPSTLTAESKLIECDQTENPFRQVIADEPLRLEGGRWYLPDAPGLGLKVRPETFEPYIAG